MPRRTRRSCTGQPNCGPVVAESSFNGRSGFDYVVFRTGDRWLLYVGDAYYLRVELETDDHPVSVLAALRADDGTRRRASLDELRRLARDHTPEIDLVGYHDVSEFPPGWAERGDG